MSHNKQNTDTPVKHEHDIPRQSTDTMGTFKGSKASGPGSK